MGLFDVFGKIFKGKGVPHQPEVAYKVTITEQGVQVEHPQRKTESIRWQDIDEVRLINTDEGPWLPDVWLALIGQETGCLIPQGAKGYDEVYDIVSQYEGFNFENVMKSMCCTSNEQFELWKKNETSFGKKCSNSTN